jgi:threonylcarbamoyladenosine tRNA methylthiotransferase MtaB
LENGGTKRQVLFEQEEEEGTMFGFTENYVKVKFPYDSNLTNTFQSIRLLETDRDGIMKVELIDFKEKV